MSVSTRVQGNPHWVRSDFVRSTEPNWEPHRFAPARDATDLPGPGNPQNCTVSGTHRCAHQVNENGVFSTRDATTEWDWAGRVSLGAAVAQAWLCTISAKPKKGHWVRLALGDTQVPCGVTRPSNRTTSARLGKTHGATVHGAIPTGRQLIGSGASTADAVLLNRPAIGPLGTPPTRHGFQAPCRLPRTRPGAPAGCGGPGTRSTGSTTWVPPACIMHKKASACSRHAASAHETHPMPRTQWMCECSTPMSWARSMLSP